MNLTDVTEKVSVGTGEQDGEHMPIYECVCGEKFGTWEAVLGIYSEDPWVCDHCGIKLIFHSTIKVLQVEP